MSRKFQVDQRVKASQAKEKYVQKPEMDSGSNMTEQGAKREIRGWRGQWQLLDLPVLPRSGAFSWMLWGAMTSFQGSEMAGFVF